MHIKKEVKNPQGFQLGYKPACSKAFIVRGNFEWMTYEEFRAFSLKHPKYCCKKCMNILNKNNYDNTKQSS